MKSLKEAIAEINSEIIGRFPKYSIDLEKRFSIFYKNKFQQVVEYGTIYESEIPNFEKKFPFIYYIGAVSYGICLKVKSFQTNNKIPNGMEVIKSYWIATLTNQNNIDVNIRFHTEEFKRLKSFLRKRFFGKIIPTPYKFRSYSMKFFIEKHKIPFITEMPIISVPNVKTIETFNLIYSDGFSHQLAETQLKYSMEYMIKNSVSIVKCEKFYKYI